MSDEKYLVHDDTEYGVLRPDEFAKLTDEQKQEILEILNSTPRDIKRTV